MERKVLIKDLQRIASTRYGTMSLFQLRSIFQEAGATIRVKQAPFLNSRKDLPPEIQEEISGIIRDDYRDLNQAKLEVSGLIDTYIRTNGLSGDETFEFHFEDLRFSLPAATDIDLTNPELQEMAACLLSHLER